jgi:hypothetical protein
MLKEMDEAAWVAGKRRTGIETRPKEMVPEAIERAGIWRI